MKIEYSNNAKIRKTAKFLLLAIAIFAFSSFTVFSQNTVIESALKSPVVSPVQQITINQSDSVAESGANVLSSSNSILDSNIGSSTKNEFYPEEIKAITSESTIIIKDKSLMIGG